LKQVDLSLGEENRWCGKMVVEWVYHFMGIWSGSELGIPSGIWVKKLSLSEIEPFLAKRF